MIKFQLRHGNDLLAMDSIKDCDVTMNFCLLTVVSNINVIYVYKYCRHVSSFNFNLLQ